MYLSTLVATISDNHRYHLRIKLIFGCFDDFFTDGLFISLTDNSLMFCRSGITFLEDLLKLNQQSVQYLVDLGIQRMWSCQINHIEKSLNSPSNIKEVQAHSTSVPLGSECKTTVSPFLYSQLPGMAEIFGHLSYGKQVV